MGKKFEVSRYHCDYGPKSLFTRAEFVFSKIPTLKLHARHAKDRLETRKIPQSLIANMRNFDSSKWKLKVLEVRNDTGKFISSSWEHEIDDERFWIVVGFNDTVQTIVRKDSSGKKGIIKSGELFDFVEQVNTKLMEDEEAAKSNI
jgi:hypothetical protein